MAVNHHVGARNWTPVLSTAVPSPQPLYVIFNLLMFVLHVPLLSRFRLLPNPKSPFKFNLYLLHCVLHDNLYLLYYMFHDNLYLLYYVCDVPWQFVFITCYVPWQFVFTLLSVLHDNSYLLYYMCYMTICIYCIMCVTR